MAVVVVVSRLKMLITEIHRRSLWQVLLIYVGGAWVCYEIIDAITDRLALPEWLPVLAIILFLIGLPAVLATAFVHEVTPPALTSEEPTPLTEAQAARLEAESAAARLEARRRHRFLSWRNAGLIFVFVLALYFQRAIQLSPGCADVYTLYAQYLIWLGRVDESIEMAARAVELDPLGPLVSGWLVAAYFYGTRYDESIDRWRRVLELDPGHVWGHAFPAQNYAMKGMYAASVAHADTVRAISRSTGNPGLVAFVGPFYAWAGEREEAERILDEVVDMHAQGSIGATAVACHYAALGEGDLAFEWLRIAVQERGGNVVFLKAMGETYLRDLRSDPRYEELLKLVGFEDR